MVGEAQIPVNRRNMGKPARCRMADYAKQSQFRGPRLPRRLAPRNDRDRRGVGSAKQSQFPGACRPGVEGLIMRNKANSSPRVRSVPVRVWRGRLALGRTRQGQSLPSRRRGMVSPRKRLAVSLQAGPIMRNKAKSGQDGVFGLRVGRRVRCGAGISFKVEAVEPQNAIGHAVRPGTLQLTGAPGRGIGMVTRTAMEVLQWKVAGVSF